MLAFSTVACAGTPLKPDRDHVPPEPIAITAPIDKKPPPVNNPAAVAELRTEFGKTALGKELLDFADEKGVKILCLDGLPDDDLGSYAAWNNTLKIDNTLPLENKVGVLAHEIRHAWQDEVLGYDELEVKLLTPEQNWILRRYIEADAFSYASYFWADRMMEGQASRLPAKEQTGSYAAALKLKEELRGDGLSDAEYRQMALGRFFDSFRDDGRYDDAHLRLAEGQENELRTMLNDAMRLMKDGKPYAAAEVFKEIDRQLETAPNGAEFEVFLRRFGGRSFDGKAATSLQDSAVTKEDILVSYPEAKKAERIDPSTPTTQEKLEIAEKEFQQLKETAQMMGALNAHQLERLQKPSKTPPRPGV